MPTSLRPLIPLCLTYLLYFGQLGILTPYLGIFLDGRGFSSSDIGTLFAIITLTRIIGPALWAGLADKRGNPLQVMQLGSFITAFLFLGVFIVTGFWGLTLVFALMMMFWTAILPQLEVITLQRLKTTTVVYGKIRLWGSIGFILLVVMVGQAIDVIGSEAPVYASVAVLSGLFFATLTIQPAGAANTASQDQTKPMGSWSLALSFPFIIFILSMGLLQISFGTYYGFFSLYMRELGYGGIETGLLIGLGVVAEVGIFLIAARLIKRFGVRTILVVSLLFTALRWWALGFAAELAFVVIATQLIHALSFGLTHATAVHFIHHFFPAHFQSRGQAIYISLSFGIGGAIGYYAAGWLWQDGQGAALAFSFAGLAAALGAVLLLFVPSKAMD